MSGRKQRVGRAALVSAFLVASVVPVGRAADETQEWRFYGGDAGARSIRHHQINRSNVKNLRIAWRQSATPQEVRRYPDAPVLYVTATPRSWFSVVAIYEHRLRHCRSAPAPAPARSFGPTRLLQREQSPTVPREGQGAGPWRVGPHLQPHLLE